MDLSNKLNGLDLFSGIGGITLALSEWVRPIAYCEWDRYAQGVLLSRMASGDIGKAPIWDDVRSLHGRDLPCEVDIIYGGFPCQDISVAGNGVGLEGKRSGLFFEIVRLAEEIKPAFIFLENVPAIRTRGLDRVIQELTQVGYDCRWTMLSAADVGANHKRERWFLLAHTNSHRGDTRGTECTGQQGGTASVEPGQYVAHSKRAERRPLSEERDEQNGHDARREEATGGTGKRSQDVADAAGADVKRIGTEPCREQGRYTDSSWWKIEPNVGRVVNGLPQRVDRLKCLGNAVVPFQAKTAFKNLMGIKL